MRREDGFGRRVPAPEPGEVGERLVAGPMVGEAAVTREQDEVREGVHGLGGWAVHRGHHDAALVRQVLHRREDALGHDRVQACPAHNVESFTRHSGSSRSFHKKRAG